MTETLANFIDGAFVAPQNGRYLDVVDPSTGDVFARCPASDATDIDVAVASARSAFPQWRRTPADERAAYLNRIADLLESQLDVFAAAESRDQGKPVSLARRVDIPRAIKNFRFFASEIRHVKNEATDMDGKALNYVHRVPLGVAGLISPWNLPLYLLTWKIAPALAAGNTAVCKPSELTPYTAYMLGGLLKEAGLPKGVCQIVLGTGPDAGSALTAHPGVALISFTGGTRTAASVMANAAPHFKKLSLELGGKNANIIFNDADLDTCVPTSVRAAFANQGEICLCGSRIFLHEAVADGFIERFVDQVSRLKVGDPRHPATDLGALVSATHRDKVRSYITLARDEGGEILFGGEVPVLPHPFSQGYFMEPTVIDGLPHTCRTAQEEIFGPVVTLHRFKDEQEVIEMANSVTYGLSASLWTENLRRAHRVAQELQAGVIWVNTWLNRDLRTPFGGMKASGMGREGGDHSLAFFTEPKNICIQLEY